MHIVYWIHDEQGNALSKMTWCRGIISNQWWKPHIFTLDGNNTIRASLPLLSLGEVTARYEPKTKHFSHCKNHRSSWPNKTQDSERLTRISNHAYKKSAKTQIYIIDNLITNPQFIGSRQTHRQTRLHRIDLHEDHGELCIEDPRERRSHLATNYGPVGLKWTTHESLEDDDDDEEALQLQSPLRQGTEKGLQMRSRGNGSLRRRKSIFEAPLIFCGIFGNL